MENKKKKILIIDDDSFLLSMYSMKFEKNGFQVEVAANGSSAIEILENNFKPDILIIDLIMPVIDGFATYEKIKKENLAPGALVVMLTNQSTTADINRAKELGIDGFIVKATTIPSEVVSEVKALLSQKQK